MDIYKCPILISHIKFVNRLKYVYFYEMKPLSSNTIYNYQIFHKTINNILQKNNLEIILYG